MKKFLGVFLCLLVISALAFTLQFPCNAQIALAADSANPMLEVNYRDSNSKTAILGKNANDTHLKDWYLDLYNGCGAIYKTTGYFTMITYQSTSVTNFELSYSEPAQTLDFISYNQHFTPYADESGRTCYRFEYDKLGVYQIKIESVLTATSTSYTNTYYIVCKSGEPVFRAEFTENNSNKIAYYNIKTGLISLKLRTTGETNYYKDSSAGEFFISGDTDGSGISVRKTSDNSDAKSLLFSTVTIDTSTNAINFTLKPNTTPANGDYIITFTANFKLTEISAEGIKNQSLVSKTKTINATLSFVDKPKRQNGLVSLLIGAGILGILGAGLYASSWLVNYAQGQHGIKLEKAMQERQRVEQEHLERLRAQAAEESAEQKKVAKQSKSKTDTSNSEAKSPKQPKEKKAAKPKQ